jgi:exopolysaccharide biosynthesis polyprenyl glycosylphosphotransferase
MLRENWRFIQRVERCADSVVIVLSFILSFAFRGILPSLTESLGLESFEQSRVLPAFSSYLPLLFLALISSSFVLTTIGAYGSMRLSSYARLLWVSCTSVIITFFFLAATLFLLKSDVSRSFLILFSLCSAVCLFCERVIVLKVLRYWRRRGRNFRNLFLYGSGSQADIIAREIIRHPELGVGIKGLVTLHSHEEYAQVVGMDDMVESRGTFSSLMGLPTFHSLPDMIRGLHNLAIDEVIFTDGASSLSEIREVIALCASQGVKTTIAADMMSLGLMQSSISYFAGIPLIHFQTPPGDRWQLGVKRVLDVVISSALMLLLLPILTIVAISIYIEDRSPVLFKQKRVGLNGRIFTLYKFRSMRIGADIPSEVLQGLNEMQGPVFKIKNDPRRTGVGRWLRRFSMDELPQLWNVLRGDMSLVGPRPPIPSEVRQYGLTDRRRLSMRPGLTCTWQVSGRNTINDFESWVRLDLDYIDNWSLSLDFSLLVKTIPAVIFGHGAH